MLNVPNIYAELSARIDEVATSTEGLPDRVDDLEESVGDIEDLIPESASAENKLATAQDGVKVASIERESGETYQYFERVIAFMAGKKILRLDVSGFSGVQAFVMANTTDVFSFAWFGISSVAATQDQLYYKKVTLTAEEGTLTSRKIRTVMLATTGITNTEENYSNTFPKFTIYYKED